MRQYAIAFLLIVVVIVWYSAWSRHTAKIATARKLFLDETDRLDITREEAEYFLQYLASQTTPPQKRTVNFYHEALDELQLRVTVPRSESRDRRPIEQIPPQDNNNVLNATTSIK